ncbi:MAG: D-aminoacyl-tRNA deacylase [Coriobacteriales bacterium]|nr:D-aminoacyl-tRNA deacylase [Coriobacteriales bacterium]
MRALLQRVSSAEVVVDNQVVGQCQEGFLIFLGVGQADDRATAQRLWNKIARLRIFADDAGKTNRSLADVGGEVLVVSQFTLYANARKGNRPSFTEAAPAALGNELYEYFCELARRDVGHVGQGVFGADMKVILTNDGPFTIWLDTDAL